MLLLPKTRIIIILLVLTIPFFTKAYGQHIYPKDADRYSSPVPGEQAMGRWDITISALNGSAPSWLEIEKSGGGALVGQFVGQGGSARPVSEIKFSPKAKKYSFTIPPQWGSHKTHLEFKLKGNQLIGWMAHAKREKLHWTGVRAPSLVRNTNPAWGTPLHLLKKGLSDWETPKKNYWTVKNGILIHQGSGGNLITKKKFSDFKLHVEFRYAKGANSGIYLRGRYELQVLDSYGMHAGSHMLGGIYGFIKPTINAAKKSGQWQTYDITLAGRMVTVVLNGTKVICHRPIPGITGGSINSHEGKPGPMMLQGSENGRIEYRNIILTPAVNR